MQRFVRFLIPSLSTLLAYFLALPWAALFIDQKFNLIWRIPFWTEPVAAVLVLVSICVILYHFWARAYHDVSAETAMASMQTAAASTTRHFHIAALLGVWLGGIGLACLLRSPCLLGIYGIPAIAGTLWSRPPESSASSARFVRAILDRVDLTPRWVILILVVAATAAGSPALSIDKQAPPSDSEPAILVQVRCKPGTSYLWKADFDKHIRPAIEDVIAKGNTFTGLQVIQSTLPWQPFDFELIYTGKSFSTLDKPGVPPHFAALFEREGSIRALAVLKEMNSYEEQSVVTIVYLTKVR